MCYCSPVNRACIREQTFFALLKVILKILLRARVEEKEGAKYWLKCNSYARRKIRLVEGNAKCCHLKKIMDAEGDAWLEMNECWCPM
jgi:hypothetical protein